MHRVLPSGGEEDEDQGEITSQVEKPFLGTDHGFREEDKIDNFSGILNVSCWGLMISWFYIWTNILQAGVWTRFGAREGVQPTCSWSESSNLRQYKNSSHAQKLHQVALIEQISF